MHPTKFNVRTRTDKKTKVQHLILEGDLGINYIEHIKTRIDAIAFESEEVAIELKKIDSFDLSSIQLVYALKKSLSENGKTVKLISDMPEDIMPILKNTGFYEFIKS